MFGSLGLDGLYNEPVGCLSMSQFFHGMAIMTSNPVITKGKNAHDGHVHGPIIAELSIFKALRYT